MERELVERAQRGDREAYAAIVAASIDRLFAIAKVTLRDLDRAEDAVQETLVKCWRELPTLRDVDRFEAWQRRTLMRSITDEFRRARRYDAKVRVLRDEPTTTDDTASLDDRDQLDRGFRRLPRSNGRSWCSATSRA